jgi:hypothetical protein
VKSADYDRYGRVTFAGVELVGKMKGCGKDSCGHCPHGPFWYAYVAASLSLRRSRAEVYLGREWTDAELKERVAPVLAVDARRGFIAAVDAVLRAERIEGLKREAVRLKQEEVAITSRAQKELADLRLLQAKVDKELRALVGKG